MHRPARSRLLVPVILGALIASCSHAPTVTTPNPARSPEAKTGPPPKTTKPNIIVDSFMSLAEALKGDKSPPSIHGHQRLVDVRYYSFDGRLHQGQIVIDEDLVGDVKEVFAAIEHSHFPIAKVVPISKYGWSDDASVAANNTSGFNYRVVPATRVLSSHAYGRAIDLNPSQNPYMDPVRGTDQLYEPSRPGAITKDSAVYKAFKSRGWTWGGSWRRGRDYQHFEKMR